MPKRGPKRGWLRGFGVIVLGCIFLVAGVATWMRGPQYVIELADGIVIAVLCFAVGVVMLWRRARDARKTEAKDGGPRLSERER